MNTISQIQPEGLLFKILAVIVFILEGVFLYCLKNTVELYNNYLFFAIIAVLYGGTALLFYSILINILHPKNDRSFLHHYVDYFLASVLLAIGINIWNYIQIDSQKILIDFFYSSVKIGFLFFLVFLVFSTAFFRKFHDRFKKIMPVIYALFLVSTMSCIFSTDFLSMPPGNSSVIFFGGTEDYVNYRINNTDLSFLEDIQTYGGFNYGWFRPASTPDKFIVYQSRTGFYGTLLKLVYEFIPVSSEKFLMMTRISFSIFMALIITALAIKIWNKYGIYASLIFSLFSTTTYWIIGPSKHIIWFYFLLFLPLLFSLYTYPRVIKKEKSEKWFFSWLFICFVFLFLKGYEYISNLALSAAIPVLYYQLKSKDFKKLFLHCLLVVVVAFLAYLVVLGIHYLQLAFYYKDGAEAFTYLLQQALFRIQGGSPNSINLLQEFRRWCGIRFFYLPTILLDLFPTLPSIIIPKNEILTLYKILGVNITITLILSFWTQRKNHINTIWKEKSQDLVTLAFTCACSMLASWTWFAAKGHMVAHHHMNGIMFVIPFGLTLFFFTGVVVQTLIEFFFTPKTPELTPQEPVSSQKDG
ncbi:MAG: hypothetical protein J7K85_02450 [Anaerolineaceae bacterium]|nr:hypothetical protein [Anaerolineaceae bacterium]